MHALHSPRSSLRLFPLLAAACVAASLPLAVAAAQGSPSAIPLPDDVGGADRGACEPSPAPLDALGCAPDQRLGLDAARPARRFASYSDLVALVRGRVSLGLALAPFTSGPLTRARFELEVVTRLRGQRGVELTARVGVHLLGEGLDGLFVSVTGGYLARVQPGGQLMLGAELGYARHFASLYVSAAAGVTVEAWSRSAQHAVVPSGRLLLGHAFY